ncbi:303_t:CDS:2, partial [Racocetra fulgida]
FKQQQKKYDIDNTDFEDYDDDNLSAYNELFENNNIESIVKKLQDAAHKYYWECDFNKTCKKVDESNNIRELSEEVNEDDDIGGPSEDKIETCKWRKKILNALEDLVLDIKKVNPTSE